MIGEPACGAAAPVDREKPLLWKATQVEIAIIEVPHIRVAGIRLEGCFDREAGLARLGEWLSEVGQPWGSRLDLHLESAEIVPKVPVGHYAATTTSYEERSNDPEVVVFDIPVGEYAWASHTGPRRDLEAAWTEFQSAIPATGRTAARRCRFMSFETPWSREEDAEQLIFMYQPLVETYKSSIESVRAVLHPRLRLLAQRAPASASDLARLKRAYANLPDDYREFTSQLTEIEMASDSGRDFRIYGPLWVLDMAEAHSVEDYIPRGIPVGDSCGDLLVYANGPNGIGLYRVGFGCMDLSEGTWVAPSLKALLVDGEGLDR